MISVILKSPYDLSKDIAQLAKEKRLSLNLSQRTLSERSGVSYGTLKKFEQTGQISLVSLLKIALALDALDGFDALFTTSTDPLPTSLDELLTENTRKRGRQ